MLEVVAADVDRGKVAWNLRRTSTMRVNIRVLICDFLELSLCSMNVPVRRAVPQLPGDIKHMVRKLLMLSIYCLRFQRIDIFSVIRDIMPLMYILS